jgi:hypothetical protein
MNAISANRPLLWAVSGGLLAALLPFAIEPLGDLLGVVPLGAFEWAVVAGFCIAVLAVVELAKAAANAGSADALAGPAGGIAGPTGRM